jgi:hypothetical protein
MSGVFDLSCRKCGSNRLRFPGEDANPVVCEDCGAAGDSLGAIKKRLGSDAANQERTPPENRAARRERHTSEVEASQDQLRSSVAETDRLVDASDKMLRRHRKECDDEDHE